jgi:hypothetical protein
VIVVASCSDVSTPQSIINCIQSTDDNGFSIDVVDSGLWFRVQNGGDAKFVSYPSASLKNDLYFMAVLRFDKGQLIGTLGGSKSLATIFFNYPGAPVANSSGWNFGTSTTDYHITPRTASSFGSTFFGKNKFNQTALTGSTMSVGGFTGTLAYAYFYDRPLYDYEIDSIFRFVQDELYNSRGIELFGTTLRNNKGVSKISLLTAKQIGGVSNFVKYRTGQPALGNTRVQQTSRIVVQTGSTKIRANQIQTGVYRIGHSAVQHTLTGQTRIQVTKVRQIAGVGRVYGTVIRQAFSVSRVQQYNVFVLTGKSRIQVTTPHVQTGVPRIRQTNEQHTQTGVSRIQVTTPHAQHGVTNMVFLTTKTRTGISHIVG